MALMMAGKQHMEYKPANQQTEKRKLVEANPE
jgi:hypothetical protein